MLYLEVTISGGGGLRPICRGMIPEWLFVPDTRDPLDTFKTVLSIGCPLRIWKGAAGDHLQTSDLGYQNRPEKGSFCSKFTPK